MEMARLSPFVFVHSWPRSRHEGISCDDTIGCKDSSANQLRFKRGFVNAFSSAVAKWQSAQLPAIAATMIFPGLLQNSCVAMEHCRAVLARRRPVTAGFLRLLYHQGVSKPGATIQRQSAMMCLNSVSSLMTTISSEAGGEAENRRKDGNSRPHCRQDADNRRIAEVAGRQTRKETASAILTPEGAIAAYEAQRVRGIRRRWGRRRRWRWKRQRIKQHHGGR